MFIQFWLKIFLEIILGIPLHFTVLSLSISEGILWLCLFSDSSWFLLQGAAGAVGCHLPAAERQQGDVWGCFRGRHGGAT